MNRIRIYLAFILLAVSISCNNRSRLVLLDRDNFNAEVDGKQVDLFTLKNNQGLTTQITNYGGRVVSLWVPDRNGNFKDIVLGYETLKGYLKSKERYFGALIGRYGNRIAHGKFRLNGEEYKLATNNGENHLHGGIKGFNDVVWNATQVNSRTLELTYLSKDMEEGYPGNIDVKVIYEITNNNELKIEYWATTDETSIVNLTHHSFFNLKGAGNGTINDHELQINAEYYTPVDKGLIPTGKIEPVEKSPMDFRTPIRIGDRVNDDSVQLSYGGGYDHNWVLRQKEGEDLNFAARVTEKKSGRVLEVYTNEPGIQFYGGNFLDGTIAGKDNKIYQHRSAFCLETQHFPNSPNQENFPSVILNPGEKYYSICVYKFSIN